MKTTQLTPRLSVGRMLFAKNGKVVSNAIVIKVTNPGFGTAFIYKLETGYGDVFEVSFIEIRAMFYLTAEGRAHSMPLKDWYLSRNRNVVKPRSKSTMHPVYLVKAVSPTLGIERNILVCAPTRRSVVVRINSHPDYKGWVVVTGDTVRMPIRGLAFAKAKFGVLASFV